MVHLFFKYLFAEKRHATPITECPKLLTLFPLFAETHVPEAMMLMPWLLGLL